jgi:hypothetical protein
VIGKVELRTRQLVCQYRDGFQFGTVTLPEKRVNDWWLETAVSALPTMRQVCSTIHLLRLDVAKALSGGSFDDYSDKYIRSLAGEKRVFFFSNNVRQGTISAAGTRDFKQIILEYPGPMPCISGGRREFYVSRNDWATLLAVGTALAAEDGSDCPLTSRIQSHVYKHAERRSEVAQSSD